MEVKADLKELINTSLCAPILVRLAINDAECYCKETQTGGAHALMNYESVSDHRGNEGLQIAREFLLPLRQKYPEISCADFWQFAAVVAIETAGGPHIPFRSGRVDFAEELVTPDGRLPDSNLGADHLRAVCARLGFDDDELVALSGANTLGSCLGGTWTVDPNKFDNSYFKELFGKTWVIKEGSNPTQFEDEETKQLMMLPSDMALLNDETLRTASQKYADDEVIFFDDFSKAFQKLQELGTSDADLKVVDW